MFALLLVILADDPLFHARTASGKDVRGPLTSVSGLDVEIGSKVRRTIPVGELLWLRREAMTLPELPRGEHLILVDGSRIPFTSIRLKNDDLLIRHPDLGAMPVAVPLSSVTVVWRSAPDGEAFPERARRRLVGVRPTRDQVHLCNGDRIEGTLIALEAEVEVERDRKVTKSRWSQVSAVLVAAESAASAKGPQAHVIVMPSEMSPGGRFVLSSAMLQRDEFVGKTTFGATLRVPLERLVRLEVLGGADVPLSSREALNFTHTPYLDENLRYGVDVTVNGRDLRLGGSWDRGLGLPAGTALTFDVKGFRRFEAIVGLDEIEGRGGKVRIAVLLDGKAADIGPRDLLGQPLALSIQLAGAKTLTLQVRYTERGPVGASVNWVDARLIK